MSSIFVCIYVITSSGYLLESLFHSMADVKFITDFSIRSTSYFAIRFVCTHNKISPINELRINFAAYIKIEEINNAQIM